MFTRLWGLAAEKRSGLDLASGEELAGCDFFPVTELGAQHLDAPALSGDLKGLFRGFDHFADLAFHRAEGADRQFARVEDL